MDPEMASAWRRRMAAAPVQRAEGRLDRIVRTIAGRADDRALELRPQARRHHPRADRRRRAAGRTPWRAVEIEGVARHVGPAAAAFRGRRLAEDDGAMAARRIDAGGLPRRFPAYVDGALSL